MIANQNIQLDAQNPWPGLATYDEMDSNFFYGREEEAEELLRLIRLSPLTVLYGKSGLGKSSLLQAGLFPRLRQEYFLPVYIRLDTASVAAVSFLEQAAHWFQAALKASLAEYPAFETDENLWCYLHRRDLEIWSQDNHLITPVFVFDQFEEVFAAVRPDLPPPTMLCRDLADLIENKIPGKFASGQLDKHLSEKLDLLTQRYRVLLSFREDFLPAIKNWERDVPSLLRNWSQLKPMSRDHAIKAVSQSGAEIVASGVAEEIVDFVGNLDKNRIEGDTAIEPVLLSLCCYQLNVRRQTIKAPHIDVELLRKVGQEILEGYYANALAKMPGSVAKFIETHLIQGDRYRSSYPESLALEEGLITQKQLSELTDLHRLLRVDQQLGAPRIELIHDRLVSVVRKARDRRRAKAEIRRAWLVALLTVVAAASFSGWQKWKGFNQTEQLIQTTEAILSRSSVQQIQIAPETAQSKRIYIQIRDSKQFDAAKKIQEMLRSNQFIVPAIEKLMTGPSTTEVRYFRTNEADQARIIVDLLIKQNMPGVTAKYISGFENSKSIPDGQFEIWFAPDAFQ
ncbi:MAG: nSTAND1 domain-containing NTPase [Methylococcaceae bacterium]